MFMGDARIVMERQPPKDFDILAIDAFSSDSIPMHLLTKECFAIYLSHLNADGILAFHISNRFLDISPIIKTFAERSQKNACSISLEGRSYWILVTNNQTFLNNKQILEAIDPETEFSRIEWTDGYSSLFPLLK